MVAKRALSIGQVLETEYCGKFEVVGFSGKDVHIKFISTGYERTVSLRHIRTGLIKDPLLPSVFNVGFIGEGSNTPTKNKKEYNLWFAMLRRAYDPKQNYKYLHGVRVSKRWHNFQTFCNDVRKIKNWNTRGFVLDKDLKVLGNKIYHPKRCCFVPAIINNLIQFSGIDKDISHGVHRSGSKFRAKVDFASRDKNIYATFNTEASAIKAYIRARVRHVCLIANKYKDSIPPDVYNNLVNIEPFFRRKLQI